MPILLGRLDDENGRPLILSVKKPILIQTVLTDILGKCVSEYWEEGYYIRLNDRAEVNEDAVMNLLTPNHSQSVQQVWRDDRHP